MTDKYFKKLIIKNNNQWATNSIIKFTLTGKQQQTKDDEPGLLKPLYIDYEIFFQDDGTIATYITNIGSDKICIHSINPSSIINNESQKISYSGSYTNNKPIYILNGNKLSFISTFDNRDKSWDLDFLVISSKYNGIYVSNSSLGLLDLKYYFSFGDNVLNEINDTFRNNSSNIYSLIENTSFINSTVKQIMNNNNLNKILNSDKNTNSKCPCKYSEEPCKCSHKHH